LKSLCADLVSDSNPFVRGAGGNDFEQMFIHLSCNQISKAIDIAENSGRFRLATLFSQIDGDPTVANLLKQQLNLWNEMNVDMEPEIIKLYRLLAGEPLPNEIWNESILKNLGWARAIGILYWYYAGVETSKTPDLMRAEGGGLGLMASTLYFYRRTLNEARVNSVEWPYPYYSSGDGAMKEETTPSGLFSLLEVLFSPIKDSTSEPNYFDADEDVILKALAPEGYTLDPLDYRGSYILLCLLECLGLVDSGDAHSYIIRQHMISQLIFTGKWQWAIFVAMQLPDAVNRETTVRGIVTRWAPLDGWETLSQDGDICQISNQAFITRDLGVPSQWIHEATAFHHGYMHEYRRQVEYLHLAKEKTDAADLNIATANRIICSQLALSELLYSPENPSTKESASRLLSLLEKVNDGIAEVDWSSESKELRNFLRSETGHSDANEEEALKYSFPLPPLIHESKKHRPARYPMKILISSKPAQ